MKYRKQIYLGFDSSGKQIRKWISADSKAELKKKEIEFRMERIQLTNPSEITFRKYSEQWIQTYKSHRAKQTQDMYRFALRKCAALDLIPVKKITKTMCQDIINESWDAPSSAATLALTMKQIFKTAMADGIIATNPATSLSLPKKPQSKFYLLTKEDLEKVRNAKMSDSDRLFVTILQVFGLRPAEALALQKTDFDFDRQILHITKAVELANDNRSRIKSTKTGVSRDIPIPAELIPSLEAQIQPIKGFLLFTKQDGSPYTKSAYRRLCERVLKAIGIPSATIYSFRHRRATDLYYLTQSGNLSTKRASELLGHSELVFLSTYSHVDADQETENVYANVDLKLVRNW